MLSISGSRKQGKGALPIALFQHYNSKLTGPVLHASWGPSHRAWPIGPVPFCRKMPTQNRTDQGIFETLQAADTVAQRLRALMGGLGPDFSATQFYTRVRVKSYDSIIKKIYSKRRAAGDELYSFVDITDIVGFRIVTLYDDDIEKAIDHLLKLIDASRSFSQPLFSPYKPKYPDHPDRITRWDYIRQAKFFRRRRYEEKKDVYELAHDHFLQRMKNEVGWRGSDHHGTKFTLVEPADEGYASVHFILNAAATVRKEEVEIPIEVQIRTAAEDIWGEINHQLLYKAEDLYVWTPTLQQTYQEMEDDLRAIKATLYELREPITRFWRHSKEAGRLI